MNRSQNILMLGLSLTGIVASSIKHDDNEFNDEHDELCHYFCLNTIFCSGSTAATILVESSRISLRSMLFSRFHCREDLPGLWFVRTIFVFILSYQHSSYLRGIPHMKNVRSDPFPFNRRDRKKKNLFILLTFFCLPAYGLYLGELFLAPVRSRTTIFQFV